MREAKRTEFSEWGEDRNWGEGCQVFSAVDELTSAVLQEDGSENILKSVQYGYDGAGNRISEQPDTLSGETFFNSVGLTDWSEGTGHYLAGDVAEVIVYDRALTPAERTRVERYLAKKYGRNFVESDFRYTGHFYHKESGLSLAPYRAYDPETARWLNRDPIGEAGGVNLYGYVANNPVNLLDPLGLDPITRYLSTIFTTRGNPFAKPKYEAEALVNDVAKPYAEGCAMGVGIIATRLSAGTAGPAIPLAFRGALAGGYRGANLVLNNPQRSKEIAEVVARGVLGKATGMSPDLGETPTSRLGAYYRATSGIISNSIQNSPDPTCDDKK